MRFRRCWRRCQAVIEALATLRRWLSFRCRGVAVLHVGTIDMIYAIPAGLAVAGAGLLTSWAAKRFDAATPPAWTQRRHAREWVSWVIMTIWMGSLLLAGQAILLLETGRESALLFAVGSGLAVVGLIPALKAVLPPIRRVGQRRP
jgi:hypothetical protein